MNRKITKIEWLSGNKCIINLKMTFSDGIISPLFGSLSKYDFKMGKRIDK